MQKTSKLLTGSKILSLLIDLFAEQENLKIEYSINERKSDENSKRKADTQLNTYSGN